MAEAPSAEEKTVNVSQRFCAPDSDITLQSCDGVLFKVHRKNLEMHSEGFAAAESISMSSSTPEVVVLTESSAVLELLLQYMYRQRQPDLRETEFRLLADLSEAAEKYEIFSAMAVCNEHMKRVIAKKPLDVMAYAFKHDYPDMMDYSAFCIVSCSLTEVMAGLPLGAMTPWLRYYQCWLEALDSAHMDNDGKPAHVDRWARKAACTSEGLWEDHSRKVRRKLRARPGSLKNLPEVFAENEGMQMSCTHCNDGMRVWHQKVQERVQNIPKFTSFL